MRYFLDHGLRKTSHIMPNKTCFRKPFEKRHGKRALTRLKSLRQSIYHIYRTLSKQLSFKKSHLGTCKILRFFVNRLTGNDKDSPLNRDNLTKPIQMEWSQKQKTFSPFPAAFLKCSLNFEHFHKKDDPHSWCISEITDSEKHG